MSEATATTIPAPRAKTVAGILAGIVLALAGALFNAGGDTGIEITTVPHPATVAQIAAIDHRVSAIERQIEQAGTQAALIESLRDRLDLLLSGARVQLDSGNPPRSRR